jgi:hypothetical protein
MTGSASPNCAIPPQILGAVQDLWKAVYNSDEKAFRSGHFRMLNHVCSSVYPEIPKSRLSKSTNDGLSRFELREALRHFFRWTGAPWHHGPAQLTAGEAAARLHSAFIMEQVHRFYLAPLDRLGLKDKNRRPPVRDEQAYKFLKDAYKLRNKYVHALGDTHETITLNDLANCRWAVTKVADEYLAFADANRDQDRQALLRSLGQ